MRNFMARPDTIDKAVEAHNRVIADPEDLSIIRRHSKAFIQAEYESSRDNLQEMADEIRRNA